MSFITWKRENRLKQALGEVTEGTVIVRKTPVGFIVILKYLDTETTVKMNRYVTLEKARKLLLEAQRELRPVRAK